MIVEKVWVSQDKKDESRGNRSNSKGYEKTKVQVLHFNRDYPELWGNEDSTQFLVASKDYEDVKHSRGWRGYRETYSAT